MLTLGSQATRAPVSKWIRPSSTKATGQLSIPAFPSVGSEPRSKEA